MGLYSHVRGDLMSNLISLFFTFFENQIKNWFTDALAVMFQLATAITNDFWTDPIINVIMAFMHTIANVILVCSLVFMLFDIAEEASGFKSIPWGTVAINFLKATLFANAFIWFGMNITNLAGEITAMFPIADIASADATAILNVFWPAGLIVSIMVACFLVAAYICFIFMSVLRFTNMFIHIFGGLYYISDIVRGDTSALGSWLRQAIVIACTYIIQFLMFTIGASILLDTSNYLTPSTVMGAGMIVGMFFVPKILQKYGQSTGITGIAGTVSQAGNILSSGRALVG